MDRLKYYQVGATHYNLDQIVCFTPSADITSVLVRFSDGSEKEFTFHDDDGCSDFIQMMRSLKF